MNKLSQKNIEVFNRRPTQTCADSIFSLADLARENLHALRANRFLQKNQDSRVMGINFDGLNKDVLIINREAIDGFLPGGSTGKKVCVRPRSSAVEKKS
jgi:hypothetical protein